LKAILVARCDYYKALITGGFTATESLTVNDISYDCYYAFLQYLYTDEVKISHEFAVELLALATEMLLPRLVNLCEEFIKVNSTVDTVCDLWMV
jgi:hypothetical protein